MIQMLLEKDNSMMGLLLLSPDSDLSEKEDMPTEVDFDTGSRHCKKSAAGICSQMHHLLKDSASTDRMLDVLPKATLEGLVFSSLKTADGGLLAASFSC
ncbi:hypothetical protein NC651_023308 [Populus alba x Populus x berolinensis]|nr:hypothetical protein NC651_023308 [Populus alba x Populus x berolinensis]